MVKADKRPDIPQSIYVRGFSLIVCCLWNKKRDTILKPSRGIGCSCHVMIWSDYIILICFGIESELKIKIFFKPHYCLLFSKYAVKHKMTKSMERNVPKP